MELKLVQNQPTRNQYSHFVWLFWLQPGDQRLPTCRNEIRQAVVKLCFLLVEPLASEEDDVCNWTEEVLGMRSGVELCTASWTRDKGEERFSHDDMGAVSILHRLAVSTPI